ncbi:MAG: arginine--tRNA ligase [Alphaproteobacteria bacterium]|nr:MAG: arginine--tRNA ligase [Alphaproteobacteria bacterium]
MDFLDLENKLKKVLSVTLTDSAGLMFFGTNKYADLSTNFLFLIRKLRTVKDDEVLDGIRASVEQDDELKESISSITILKNGFVNFSVSNKFLENGMNGLLKSGGKPIFDNKSEKVNVEFVSANPTGPLHYGNARSVYGDALANVLKLAGYDVTKEYYVNDAGNQINVLADSVFSKYLELQNLKPLELTESYQGEYITDIAQEILNKDFDKWNSIDYRDYFKKFSVECVIKLIKEDLAFIGIKHDVWVFETSIVEFVPHALRVLENKHLIAKGKLGKIQSDKGLESNEDLLLFLGSKLGDEDRALTKPDGSYTYFANDIGYFYNKLDRGFKWLIVILGADHDGYIKRLYNAVTQLKDDIRMDIKTCQVVLFQKNGENIRFSKRLGNALSLREAVESIGFSVSDFIDSNSSVNTDSTDYNTGKDIFRFMMLNKSLDTHYTVNADKLTEFSMENPFYYLQYAHARISSLVNSTDISQQINLDSLTDSMIELLKLLLNWRKCIESVVRTLEVHKVIHFLLDVAEQFHAIWNEGKIDKSKKWIVDNLQTTHDRVAFASIVGKMIKEGLNVLGIDAYDRL